MRPPSQRLRSNGRGPDSVLVYAMDEVDDHEGKPVRTPRNPPVAYDAIVEPSPGVELDAAGSQLNSTTYQILIYSSVDPLIRVRDPIVWEGRILNASGDFTPAARGAYDGRAVEVTPDLEPDGVPHGL